MATLPQLEKALVNAHNAGDTDAARRLAKIVKDERLRRQQDPDIAFFERLPDRGPEEVPGTVVQDPDATLGEKAIGALETGATMATAMTGGVAGQIQGAVEGIIKEINAGEFGTHEAADRIEQLAMERASELTFSPRTETGQEMLQATGEALEPLAAIPPIAETQLLANAAARIPARAVTNQRVVQPVTRQSKQLAKVISDRVKQRVKPAPTATAANADDAILRRKKAESLGFKDDTGLTEGQATRDFDAQQFEQTTAKLPTEGTPIRERFENQNLKVQQVLDDFIDQTGSEVTNLRGVGEVVDKALRARAAKDKVRIRTLYKDAEKAGEMQASVQLDDFVKHLNDSAPEAEVANVLKAVRAKAVRLGAAVEDPDGNLLAKPVTLKNAELLRRSINDATNAEPTNIRQASIMKGLIDDTTEGAGGTKYKAARRARARYAKDYENVGLVKNLLGLKKGTEDRAIALEDVLRKSVLEPSASLDSVRQVRRLLQTAGPEGKQAWKELQGGTLRHIQDQMLKNVATNQRGDRVVSAAQLDRVIKQLDKTGKLAFIFGKKGAEQLRTVNEVAKVIFTAPPGTINTSNTATVLAGLMDVAVTGMSGVPAPIATSFRVLTRSIEDKKLKARIEKTLGGVKDGE